MTVPTRVSGSGLGVFGRRHGDEHHGDVVGRLLFAQSEVVVHPWRPQQSTADQIRSDQSRADQISPEESVRHSLLQSCS